MASDEPSIETLVDKLNQVFARHNELFQDHPENALTVALQVLDERRASLGVDATVEQIDEHDCAMVRFGSEYAAMLGVAERTMSYFEEIRETLQDDYGRDVLMRKDDGKLVNPGGGRRV